MTQTDQNLDLIIFGWVDALRRRDPDRIADRLAEDIVWQGFGATSSALTATPSCRTSPTAAQSASRSPASM
jgi:ketosteroid isomerase-like protein